MEIHDLKTSDPDELFNEHIRLLQTGIAKHPAALFAAKYEAKPNDIRRDIEAKTLAIALAIHNGQCFGTISMYRPTFYKRRHKATIASMYVDTMGYARATRGEEVPKNGLGWLLTEHMLKLAKTFGYETVVSNTATSNHHIHKINESLGGVKMWTELRGMKLADGTYVDTYTYEFDLLKD